MASRIKDPEARFWSHVDRPWEGCWEWQGCLNIYGYGKVGIPRVEAGRHGTMGAHRLAWEYTNGPIPEGLCVLHICDNPPCCNPAHLRLGTKRDNTLDMVAKGRHGSKSVPDCNLGSNNGRAKLTEELVLSLRRLHAEGVSQKELADQLRMPLSTIHNAVSRKSWKHI